MGEQKQRMLRGELYRWDEPELFADYERAQLLLERFNATSVSEPEERRAVLAELFGAYGEGAEIRPPFRCDYGYLTSIGERTFVNYGAVFLDVAEIRIGCECQIATNVQLLTPTHPLEHRPRRAGWESAAPITIEDGVWLGGGVIVCPGVRIGENTVVGAGSVVVRDLPAGRAGGGQPLPPDPRGRLASAPRGHELYLTRAREEHRQAVAGVTRRDALLAQHHGAERTARVELRGQLGGQLARHPAQLRAPRRGVHRDRVGVVLVGRIAAQLERAARRGVGGGHRLGVVLAGAGHPRHVQAALCQRGIVAGQEAAAAGLDQHEPGQPDLPAVVGVPVALLVANVDSHMRKLAYVTASG